MNANKNQDDRFLISFSDVLAILRRSKKKILICACLFALLGLTWAVTRPIRFLAEATFREKGIKQSPLATSSSLIHLLSGGSSLGNGESEATSLMMSRVILKDVIEKLHLQAILQPHHDAETLSKLAFRNLSLTWAALSNNHKPMLKDLCCPLKIETLKYSGEEPLSFTLKLEEKGKFKVIPAGSQTAIGEGQLNQPFQFETLSFTISPSESSVIPVQSFGLTILPLADTAKHVSRILKIEPSKLDKSLLKVQFEHRDRHLASQVVNTIMESFQDYSKNYHGEMAIKQLDYLSARRDQLSENLVGLMQKHANFLANDLYSSGFIESNKEMDFLAKSQHEYKRKLLDNELEIKRLTSIKIDNFAHFDRYSANDGDPTIINNIFSEMRALKQQRDALEIETQKKAIDQGTNLQHFFDQQVKELHEVQQYLIELNEINEQFQNGNLPNLNSKLLNDPRFLLKGWFERLQNARLGTPKIKEETEQSLQFYLNNLERLFGVHERILQERLTHQQNPSGEYQGINLEVATDLYRDYSKQLIQMESTIRQNVFFIHQIEDPNFEITSLSAGLNDPISAEIIQKASQLVLRLRDQNNQSIREQERIKEELNLERTFLNLHLQQMVQLMELNKQLINEKVLALQNVSLELIHQRISLLEKNLQDYLHSRLHNLQQERALIKLHLENIHLEMAQLPQKWVSEQLLTQEVATNHLIVEEIAKLVETKNISHNLEVIQSAPVDIAIPSLHPVTPKVILLSILGFLVGGFLCACFVLTKSLSQGLRVSPQYLEQMGCHVSGYLDSSLSSTQSESPALHGTNLETLRRLQIYFDQSNNASKNLSPLNKFILLIEGKGPHYATLFAKLLSKRGDKVITLNLNFTDSQNPESGLLQYLQGDLSTLPIQKGEYGDWIAAGGQSSFAMEMVNSPTFQQMIEELSRRYDWIVAFSQAMPESVETECLVSVSQQTAVNLHHEKIEDIKYYLQFLKSHPQHKMSFLFVP